MLQQIRSISEVMALIQRVNRLVQQVEMQIGRTNNQIRPGMQRLLQRINQLLVDFDAMVQQADLTQAQPAAWSARRQEMGFNMYLER
jgi:hypothetical protein